MLSRWRKEYEAGGEEAFSDKHISETAAFETRIAELEWFWERLALENETLKKPRVQ